MLDALQGLSPKLWLYTNFDCNQCCSYCVTESHPRAARLALRMDAAQRYVDDAVLLGFTDVFITGGEPFLLDEIYGLLAYSAERLSTTVLTNASLLRGARLQRLAALNNSNLHVQVSLDGARPEQHDPYRGRDTWQASVAGIFLLKAAGLHVCVAATETPANANHLEELQLFLGELGIEPTDYYIRPLARRGLSTEGAEMGMHNLQPEVTVTAGGIFWHPLSGPSQFDLRVSDQLLPLAEAAACIRQELHKRAAQMESPSREFT